MRHTDITVISRSALCQTSLLMSLPALAAVELQLIMRALTICDRLKLARTCKFALQSADAPFAFAGSEAELKLSLPSFVPLPTSLALRHAAVSIVWIPADDPQHLRLEDWIRRFPRIHAFDASASTGWIDSNRWRHLTCLPQFQHIRRIALPLHTHHAVTEDMMDPLCALPRLESFHIGDVRARFSNLPVLSALVGMPSLTDLSCTPYLCLLTLDEFRQVSLCRHLRCLAISLPQLHSAVTMVMESPSLLQLERLQLHPTPALNRTDDHLMRMISAMQNLRHLSFSTPEKPVRLLAALTIHQAAHPFPPLFESITLQPSLGDAPSHAHFGASIAKLLAVLPVSACFILLFQRGLPLPNDYHSAVEQWLRFHGDPLLQELHSQGRIQLVWKLSEAQPEAPSSVFSANGVHRPAQR